MAKYETGGKKGKIECPGNPRKPGGSMGMPKKATSSGSGKKPSRKTY